ncbi:hypothetical protein D3C75_549400 [compost metagenome]
MLGWWSSQLNGSDVEGQQESLKLMYPGNKYENYVDKIEEHKELTIDAGNLTNTLKDLRIPANELLTLNFQLNQLLMLLNNPMLFPHFAYAKAFREIVEVVNDSESERRDSCPDRLER